MSFPEFPWPPFTTKVAQPRQSFELTVEGHSRAAKEIGDRFKEPDDDWAPMLILDTQDTRWIVPLIQLMNEDTKGLLANYFIPGAILVTQAWCASFVTSAWGVFKYAQSEAEQEKFKAARRYSDLLGEGVTPSSSPDREEVVLLNTLSKDQVDARIARIYRKKNSPPKLGKWDEFGKGTIGGQFFDPMREALKMVNA